MGEQPFPWPPADFEENRHKIPLEVLLPYNRMQIAYSWDGTRVLDGDPDLGKLFAKLDAAGIDANRVVFDYFEYSDVAYIGPLCDSATNN